MWNGANPDNLRVRKLSVPGARVSDRPTQPAAHHSVGDGAA